MPAIMAAISELFTLSHFMTGVYILNFLIAFGIIFWDKKSPTASMAWIMILFMIPVLGLVLYIIFSQNIARRQIFKMTESEEIRISNLLHWQKEELREGRQFMRGELISRWHWMINHNIEYADSILTDNESIELICDGHEMFDRLCAEIEKAEYTIKLCYFVIKNDEVGTKLLELLTRKAAEGVTVRLLMDALGSKSIGRKELKAFTAAGGQYAFFFKPIFRHLYLNINYRNHRKLGIIDNKIGFIGGFNIAKEYLGLKKKFGYWRDTQLIIRGNAVATLNERFYLDWRYATGEQFDVVDASAEYAVDTDVKGDIPIQIVSCGPESPKDEIKRSMMRMINGALESIYVQTPYLVPDQSMMEALGMAARSGIDVRIMIPCMPDHPFVYRTTLFNAGELLKEGARIYIYDNGFLHAKTLTVDGQVATAGSCNFDIRSFKLNFETNAFVYDRKFCMEMNEQFERDMLLSHEYTLEDREKLSVWDKFCESISRLLTEIL